MTPPGPGPIFNPNPSVVYPPFNPEVPAGPMYGLGVSNGSAPLPFVMDTPENHGAMRDNLHDDTAAIKAAINNAVAMGIANGSNYAEVWFSAGQYRLSGATTQGGSTHGNAQLPLPVIATTGEKFTLVLRGTSDVTGLLHWQETIAQTGGAFLNSTLVGTNDGTFGEASVIGGPTPAQGYGEQSGAAVFSNMLIVVSGLGIAVPSDPHVCGFDFRGVAEANLPNAACGANAPNSAFGTTSNATQSWQFGLTMPQNDNNANSNVGFYSCWGLYYGFIPDEHTYAQSIRAIHCVAGVELSSSSQTFHGMVLDYVCVENCQVAVGAVYASNPVKVLIRMLDIETITFAVINDASNLIRGEIRVVINTGFLASPAANTDIRGGTGVKILDMQRIPGSIAAPSMPATATTFVNPFNRDAAINISGGTVTVIQVGSQATGLTSGTVILPAGQGIAFAYSAAPSWVWTLL